MTFPTGFLWGTASAAHQIEGGNVASDCWLMEHVPSTLFAEPSGDACDSYHRWQEDVDIIASMNLGLYRFGIEWARIEPVDGEYSRAAVAFYRRMLQYCKKKGLNTMVTLHHFTQPLWYSASGGFAKRPQKFAEYARFIVTELGALIDFVCTINELNLQTMFASRHPRQAALYAGKGKAKLPESGPAAQDTNIGVANTTNLGKRMGAMVKDSMAAAGVKDVEDWCPYPFGNAYDVKKMASYVIQAHRLAVAAVHAADPRHRIKVGFTIANPNYVAAPGGEVAVASLNADSLDQYLDATSEDDFVGVQGYSSREVGPDGFVPPPEGTEVTQMGYIFHPESIGIAIRYCAHRTGKPVIVTENGIGTLDDSRRREYIVRAVREVRTCIQEGIQVQGYCYWSIIDNFEWFKGYEPKFGLVECDRITFDRMVKPSGRLFAQIALTNGAYLATEMPSKL